MSTFMIHHQNALSTGKERISLSFLSSKRTSKISTESFANNTITGLAKMLNSEVTFQGGTLQTISCLNAQYGGSHTSHVLLESGEFYSDIGRYYSRSEQTPTYFFPLSHKDNPENIVLLIQPLPFANEGIIVKVIEQVRAMKPSMSDFSFQEVISVLSTLLLNWTFLESMKVDYKCGCSKDMFLGLIFSLTKEEIDSIISKDEELEAFCPLCGKKYSFSSGDILFFRQ